MRLTIVFVIALIATCVAAKDEEEGVFGLEEWVKKLGANTLGSCRQKFTELVKKLGYKYVYCSRQLSHYDVVSIYTVQKHQLTLKID